MSSIINVHGAILEVIMGVLPLQTRGGSWELAGSFVGGPIDYLGEGGGGVGAGSSSLQTTDYITHRALHMYNV